MKELLLLASLVFLSAAVFVEKLHGLVAEREKAARKHRHS